VRAELKLYLMTVCIVCMTVGGANLQAACDLGKILPGTPTSSETFGAGGNSLAMGAAVALVGESGANGKASSSGAAYVSRLTGGTWSQEAKLVGSDSASYDDFGYAVDIDGDVAVVGAKKHNRYKGAVYVFVYDLAAGQWREHQKLSPAADDGDSFGFSVAVSGDLIVGGAPGDDDVGSNYGGAAYVYRRNAHTGLWEFEKKLLASDGGNVDWSGWDVDVSGDCIAVGAPRKNSMRGAVYVYRHNGLTWTQEQKLIASDGAANDFFGENVSLNGQILVGSAKADDDKGDASGSVYVFRYNTVTKVWTQEQKLLADDGASQDYFGSDVAVSGNFAVVGSVWDDDGGNNSGSAYTFAYKGPTLGWIQSEKLRAPISDAEDKFGSCVAAWTWMAMVGTPGDDDAGTNAGAAYVRGGFSDKDCNGNGVPDECDIGAGTSADANGNGIPDECELPDLDGDEDVDASDLAVLGTYWHRDDCSGAAECAVADVTGDGRIYADDLAELSASWLAGVE